MNVDIAQVQAAVQQLVIEHGEYAPLELLLATNRLGYEDYRAWREGRLETLDAVLTDGGREIRAWLEGAQSWADALGLAPEPAVHHGWEQRSGTVLVASVDAPVNSLLSTRFRHAREHDQLDLFLDSAQSAAVNGLLDALTVRDAGKARGALARLVRLNGDHRQRLQACSLVSSLEAPAPVGPERGLEQLERMERGWVPAASALLGARRRDFLAPLWRDIGQALELAPFDPDHPEQHATRAYREGLDWDRVRRSALAVPGYENEPALLARLAEADWRLHDRVKAIESWFALCHLAPEAFEALIEAADFPDWALRSAWRVALEQDPEHVFTPEWFPARMLLEEPGLAAKLAPRHSDDDPSRAFDAVMAVMAHPSPDGRGIELRRSLQAIHPGLLERFLANPGHRGSGQRDAARRAERRLVHHLSVGERQRVEIVRCLLQRPKLLVLDEPTSVLTPQAARSLFETLRVIAAEGCSLLYISHKLEEIRELCDNATILRAGAVAGTADPKTTSPAELAAPMVGSALPETHPEPARPDPAPRLEVRGLDAEAEDPFGTELTDVSLAVHAGEVVGIAGVSGNGQAELASLLSGERTLPAGDSVRLDGEPIARLDAGARRRRGLAFIPEDRLGRGVVPLMSLRENVILTAHGQGMVRGGMLRRSRADSYARRVIERFDVRCTGTGAIARALSGGNLQKFIVGREVELVPRVLVVSQPTWGLDVAAAAFIRQSLIDLSREGAAVLVISEELDELLEVCDRIAVLYRGRLSACRKPRRGERRGPGSHDGGRRWRRSGFGGRGGRALRCVRASGSRVRCGFSSNRGPPRRSRPRCSRPSPRSRSPSPSGLSSSSSSISIPSRPCTSSSSGRSAPPTASPNGCSRRRRSSSSDSDSRSVSGPTCGTSAPRGCSSPARSARAGSRSRSVRASTSGCFRSWRSPALRGAWPGRACPPCSRCGSTRTRSSSP